MKHLFKLDNQQSAEMLSEDLEGWTIVKGAVSYTHLTLPTIYSV